MSEFEVEVEVKTFSVEVTIDRSIIGGGGSGDFHGPSSSVDGDILIFDGTDGKKAKDSGIDINVLAPEDVTTIATLISISNEKNSLEDDDEFPLKENLSPDMAHITWAQIKAALLNELVFDTSNVNDTTDRRYVTDAILAAISGIPPSKRTVSITGSPTLQKIDGLGFMPPLIDEPYNVYIVDSTGKIITDQIEINSVFNAGDNCYDLYIYSSDVYLDAKFTILSANLVNAVPHSITTDLIMGLQTIGGDDFFTPVMAEPYFVMIKDSTNKFITGGPEIKTIQNGVFWDLEIYSSDIYSNCKIYILC